MCKYVLTKNGLPFDSTNNKQEAIRLAKNGQKLYRGHWKIWRKDRNTNGVMLKDYTLIYECSVRKVGPV